MHDFEFQAKHFGFSCVVLPIFDFRLPDNFKAFMHIFLNYWQILTVLSRHFHRVLVFVF